MNWENIWFLFGFLVYFYPYEFSTASEISSLKIKVHLVLLWIINASHDYNDNEPAT